MLEQLGINPSLLLTQLISALVLLFLLYRILHKPITEAMHNRAEKVKQSLEAADTARAEASASAKNVQQELLNAQREGQRLIAEARVAAEQLRQRETERTEREVDDLHARAQKEIQRERAAAVEDLRKDFSSLAISAAERVIKVSLDASAHSRLIDETLEEALRERKN